MSFSFLITVTLRYKVTLKTNNNNNTRSANTIILYIAVTTPTTITRCACKRRPKGGHACRKVPRPEAADLERGGKLLLGMTGVVGPAGLLKGYMNSHQAVRIQANSTRLDDELTGSDANVCMLKADVEGYEPQVLLTAKRMLRMRRVRAVQLELTRANDPKQVQANINMLEQLVAQNLTIRHVRHDTRVYSPQGGIVHDWRAHSKTAFASFQHFPLPGRSVASGWAREFGFSTNVLAVQDEMSL